MSADFPMKVGAFYSPILRVILRKSLACTKSLQQTTSQADPLASYLAVLLPLNELPAYGEDGARIWRSSTANSSRQCNRMGQYSHYGLYEKSRTVVEAETRRGQQTLDVENQSGCQSCTYER